MTNILLLASFLLVQTSFANIEYDGVSVKPTQAERTRNRACFEELKINGCGDPGEDPQHFRSCMSQVFEKLSPECQAMMNKLYR
jgi:hypothetical protein